MFEDLPGDRPGLVAGIHRGRVQSASQTFGAESPGGAALTAATPIYVASVAKQFTAAVVAGLVLDGTLALSQTAAEWFPEAPPWWQPVTIEHLVNHTAGLATRAVDAREDLAATHEERVASILGTRPARRPGREHHYCNDGYVLLADIARRATGSTLGGLARRQLFDPAGMDDSDFVDIAGWRSVPGWIGGLRPVSTRVASVGDGGLISTVTDLLAWMAWYPRQPIAALMLADRPLMPGGRTAHDAWGVSIRTHHGRVVHSHGGAVPGYLASTVTFPDLDLSVAVLANTDDDPDGFRRRIHRLIDGALEDDLDLTQPSLEHTHGVPPSRRPPSAARAAPGP